MLDRAPTTVHLAGLDQALLEAERLALPVLPNPDADRALGEAVHTAMTQGRMVAVCGPKGSGKTLALHRVIASVEAGEAEREAASAEYTPRALIRLGTLRSEDGRAILGMLYRAAMGIDLRMTGAKGQRHAYEYLLEVVVQCLQHGQVVALIIDEAELLSPTALTVLRDLLAVAESAAADRLSVHGSQSVYRPSPLGIVLVGTDALHHRLVGMSEWGERVMTCLAIPPMAWSAVHAAYTGALPTIAAVAAEDPARWEAVLGTCWSSPPSWRAIENHLRTYLRVLGYAHPNTATRTLDFDANLFVYAATQLARSA